MQVDTLKINTKNGLEEAKQINNALRERYALEQDMGKVRSQADYNKKVREREEEEKLIRTLEEEEKIISEIEEKRKKMISDRSKSNQTSEEKQNQAINKYLEEQYQLQLKINDLKKSVSSRLDSSANTGLFNSSTIENYRTQLGNLSSKPLEEQITVLKKLKEEISGLEKSENQISKLQNVIKDMTSNLGNIKTSFGTDKSVNEIANYENQLSKLKSMLKDLQNGVSIKPFNVSNEVKEMQNMNTALKNSLSGFKSAEESANVFQSALSQLDSKIIPLQNKLNTLSNNGLINPEVISNLQSQLNSINIYNLKEKIEELKGSIDSLGQNESGINRLKSTINSMEGRLSSLKDKFGNTIDSKATQQLNEYQQQLQKLKDILTQLQNGQSIGGNKITSEIESMKNASRDLNAQLNSTGDSVTTFSQRLQSSLSNMGIYVSTAIAIEKAMQEIKKGISEVVEVENSMTNLRRIYEITDASAQQLTKTLSDQALALAGETSEIIDLTTTWKKLGYSINEAQELATVTKMYDYAADLKNTEKTATDLVAILKGFGKDASDALDIADKIDNVSNQFSVSAGDINEALKRSSSALGAFGNSAEQSIAMATTLNEVLQNASSSGQALKSISARLTSNKNAIEAIEQVGISINDQYGNLKSTYDLIKELGEAYRNMRDDDKTAKWLSSLFGVMQVSNGATLLRNFEQLDNVMAKIEGSSGVVTSEFEQRLDTTSAKVEVLKQTLNQFWESTISSDFTKGVVEGVTKLVEVFGNLPTVIGLATTALMLFKGVAIKDFIMSMVTSLSTFITTLFSVVTAENAMAIATGEVSIAMNNLKLAFMSNPLGMLAVAITTCIVVFTQLNSAMDKTTDKIIEQGNSVKKLDETISSLQNAQQRLNELSSKENLSTDEKEELVNLNRDLCNEYPELISYYDYENKCFVANKDALDELIAKKRENMMMENAVSFGDARGQIDEYQKEIDRIKEEIQSGEQIIQTTEGKIHVAMDDDDKRKSIEQINEIQDKMTGLNKVVNQGIKIIADFYNEFISNGGSAEQATSELERFGYSAEEIQYALAMVKSEGNGVDEVSEKIKVLVNAIKQIGADRLTPQTIEEINRLFPEIGLNAENAKDKVNVLRNTLNDLDDGKHGEAIAQAMEDIQDSVSETTDRVKELNETFNSFSSSLDMIDTVKEELSEYGSITNDTLGKIIEKNPEILEALMAEGDTIDNLNNLYEEQAQKLEESKEKAIEASLEKMNQSKSEAESKKEDSNDEAENEIENESSKVEANSEALGAKSENDAIYNDQVRENSDDTSTIQQENDAYSVNANADGLGVKSENDATYNNQVRENSADTTAEQAVDYSNDVKNNAEALNNKSENNYSFFDYVNNLTGGWLNNLVESYKSDLENFKNYCLDKFSLLRWLYNGTNKIEGENSNSEKEEKKGYVGGNFDNQVAQDEGEKKRQQEEEEKKAQQEYKKTAPKLNSNYKTSLGTITKKQASDITQAKKDAESARKKSESEAKKAQQEAKKAQQEAEKLQKEIEKFQEQLRETVSDIEIDRYYSLNNALTDIENSMKDLKTAQESMSKSEYQNSLLDEINLINKKKEAIHNLRSEYVSEAEELKEYLSKYYFYFDENTGDIKNSQTRLLEIQNDINTAYYEASEAGVKEKKENIKWVEELQDKVERYTDLIHSEIPKCIDDFNGLTESVRSMYKTMAQDVRNDLVSAIKKSIQKQQETWEVTFEGEESSYRQKEEYYNEKIKRLQKELDALNDDSLDDEKKMRKLKKELELWKKDDSALGKQKRQSLTEQINDLQKNMDKKEIQSEIDAEKERFDAYKEAHDKEKEATKKHFEDLLDERRIYEQADKLITENKLEEINKLLIDYGETYKETGVLWGENISAGIMQGVKNGLQATGMLKVDLIDRQNQSNPIYYTQGSANSNLFGSIKHYADGGEIPKSITQGERLAFVGAGERVLTPKDNENMKQANKIIVSDLKEFIEKYSSVMDSMIIPYEEGMKLNAGIDINDLVGGIVNNSETNNTSKIEINNEFNVTNESQVKADHMPKDIENMMKTQIRKYGRRI